MTNTTLNTIEYPLSVKDLEDHATIRIMPNPFKDFTTISVSGIDMTGSTLEVSNMIGQTVNVVSGSGDGVFHFSRTGLNAGVYIYRVNQNGRTIGTGKMVIE